MEKKCVYILEQLFIHTYVKRFFLDHLYSLHTSIKYERRVKHIILFYVAYNVVHFVYNRYLNNLLHTCIVYTIHHVCVCIIYIILCRGVYIIVWWQYKNKFTLGPAIKWAAYTRPVKNNNGEKKTIQQKSPKNQIKNKRLLLHDIRPGDRQTRVEAKVVPVRFDNWLGAFGLSINVRRTRAHGRDTVNIKTANLFDFYCRHARWEGCCRAR